MTEPKKSSALKWILIGCGGIVVLGLLCTGGCFTFIYVVLKSLVEEVSPVGVAYLKEQPEVEAELGTITKAEHAIFGSSVQKINDGGAAQVRYLVEGSRGSGEATVWFERSTGKWEAVGCEVRLKSGKTVKTGREVKVRSSDWDD